MYLQLSVSAYTISTHAPRTGSDVTSAHTTADGLDFNPRSPHGERQLCCCHTRCRVSYFNPRSPHGERHHAPDCVLVGRRISTHAPRTGSDMALFRAWILARQFQPTLPARGATMTWRRRRSRALFQPTLPARGATETPEEIGAGEIISTHAPRTGSDGNNQLLLHDYAISTHAPRTGSDSFDSSAAVGELISTHAPRTGSDAQSIAPRSKGDYFNPRSPHGERR